MGVPVLGGVDDIPQLIEEHDVEEVIIGRPELTHQEVLSIISRCERGQVGIKIFPDLFQIIATELSIGDLGGLPLADRARRGPARLEADPQAGRGPGGQRRRPGASLAHLDADGPAHQARFARPGLLCPGADGAGCQAILVPQVPLHAHRRRKGRAGLDDRGRSPRYPPGQRLFAASPSTNCPNSSTSSWAR